MGIASDAGALGPAREVEAVVCDAIMERRQVYFDYRGGRVVFAPHVVWRDAAVWSFVSGIVVSSNDPQVGPGVASFPLSELQAVTKLGAPFVVDPSVPLTGAAGGVVCVVA